MRARGVVVTGLVLVALIAPAAASADEPSAIRAHDRPRIGLVCARWSQRVEGDFDGNGRIDHAVFYDLAPASGRCREERLPARWHVIVFRGRSGNGSLTVRLPPCQNAPSSCGIRAVDLNGDGTDELAVTISGGIQGSDWRLYSLAGSTPRIVTYLGPPIPRLHLRPGEPAILGAWTGIATHSAWGCRRSTRATVAASVATARDGDPHHRWTIEKARLSLRGASLVLLARRELIRRPSLGHAFPRPKMPSTRSCAA